MLELFHEDRFADLAVAQVYATLLDEDGATEVVPPAVTLSCVLDPNAIGVMDFAPVVIAPIQ